MMNQQKKRISASDKSEVAKGVPFVVRTGLERAVVEKILSSRMSQLDSRSPELYARRIDSGSGVHLVQRP